LHWLSTFNPLASSDAFIRLAIDSLYGTKEISTVFRDNQVLESSFRFIVLYSRTMKKRFVSYFGRVKFIGSNSLWNRGFWESLTRCIGEPSTRCCLCHCQCTQTSHNLAAEMGFEGRLKALFACGAPLFDKDDITGDTAIHCACRPRSTPLSCTFH